MALQRNIHPLPVGLYWIDVVDVPHQQEFQGWAQMNPTAVKVITTEHHDANDWPTCSNLDPTTGGCWPSVDWVKFQVLSPVNWDAVNLGFPNIITAGEVVNSSQDTSINPPDDPNDCDIACQAEKVGIAAALVAGATVVIILAAKLS